MQVISQERVFIDVDSTLIFNHQGNIKVSYYGQERFVRPHLEHIAFLKSLKSRGYHITVWSGNGYAWCQTIIKALELESYVDECSTKPFKVVDDKPVTDWMPNVVYIDEQEPAKVFLPSGNSIWERPFYPWQIEKCMIYFKYIMFLFITIILGYFLDHLQYDLMSRTLLLTVLFLYVTFGGESVKRDEHDAGVVGDELRRG